MKSFNIFRLAVVASAALVLSSCAQKARVQGVVNGASESEIVVSLLKVNTLEPIDTVKTDGNGRFSVKVDVKKGEPEFVYLYRNGVRVAPLLLQAGDRITVETDTLGNCNVTGNPEAELYVSMERNYAEFVSKVDGYIATDDVKNARLEYINYYRNSLRFIAEHPYSIVNVPLMYQTVADGVLVFGQQTDAIHFTRVCDSLETVYPDSKYVKALRKAADERRNVLDLQLLMKDAGSVGFIDIELPDINAQKQKLSDVKGKVIMLHYWTLTPEQKMMNLDVLLPLYKEYHSKGLEIYQVALEGDKTAWAATMKAQNLPWVNVCDVNEASSKYVSLYALQQLPSTFFIAGDELINEPISSESDLRKLLDKLLK